MLKANRGLSDIPEETKRVAKAIYPKGNLYMQIRDEFEGLFSDEMFADLYPSQGCPGISPGQLAFVLVMQYIAGYSDRQVAEAVRDKISWKYALGLTLEDGGFDHSVLSDFRQRLLANHAQQRLFDSVLDHLKGKGLLQGKRKQRTDATHVVASVRNLNRIELAGETMRITLEQMAQIDPHGLRQILPQEWIDRYGQRFNDWHLPQQKAKRDTLVNQIGADGYVLLTWIYQLPDSDPLRQLREVEMMRQIWVQQFWCDEHDQIYLRDVKDTPPGEKLIQTPFDVEARFSQERSGKAWLGYKTHVTETCAEEFPRIITHVETGQATDNDCQLTSQIQIALQDKDLQPDEHYVDVGYASIKEWVASQKREIELMTPMRADPTWQAKDPMAFDQSTFFIDWDQQQATCPQGAISRVWSTSHNAAGDPVIHVRFAQKDCQSCPLKQRCTHAKCRSLKLFARQWQMALIEARRRQTTTEFRTQYRIRAGIEATFSAANRTSDLRHTPFVGLDKTHFHALMSAVALNIKRTLNWLNEVPIALTRLSRLQLLAHST